MTLAVRTPARLHLGFIDLNGDCGRLFGSLGVAIEKPGYSLEATVSDHVEADGPAAADVLAILERLRPTFSPGRGLAVRVVEAIPRHAGLGSGTQLELALAFAASRLLGHAEPVRELARLGGRGRRSGIGVAIFESGGFVVDAGKTLDTRASAARDRAGTEELPPVIFRHSMPEDWFFVLAIPSGVQGLNGAREEAVFVDLPRMSAGAAGRISRLVLMKALPAVVGRDIRAFGEAITEIQALVGDHFAPYQGGRYATRTGERAADLALKRGAYGVGQSSWGPTVFALVRGEPDAAELSAEITERLGPDGGRVLVTRASQDGMRWSLDP
jgi:beta-ribofuranosylaminobenzene 5'-phosphate synthase